MTTDDTIERLCNLAIQSGRADLAGELSRMATTQPPETEDASQLHARGVAALNAQKPVEAMAYLQRAIRAKPQIAHWHEALGVAFAQQKRFAEAVATLKIALKIEPKSHLTWHNLALAYGDLKQHDLAEKAYREASRLNPDSPDIALGLIRTLNELKKYDESAVECRRLTIRHPQSVPAWSALGITLFHAKKHEESIAVLRHAIAMNPHDAELHANLAAALGQTKQWDECEIVAREAVRLNPNYSVGWGNLGNCLREMGRLEEAEPALRKTVQLNPRDFEAASNLALTLSTLGRQEESLSWYDHALNLQPDNGRVRFNRALNLLLLGDFVRGWNDYEFRFDTDQMQGTKRQFPVPEWTGGPLQGRTILVHCEQGAGDVIQFIRYVKELSDRGATVLVQPPRNLSALMKTVPGIARVVDEPKIEVTVHCHCSVMSLPYRLKINATDPQSVGRHVPYVEAPLPLRRKWSQRLAKIPGIKVGIAWQGNPKHIGDRWRSIPLSLFEPLSNIPGVQLCSIQKGPGIEQLAESKFCVVDLGSEISGDFDDTAGLIAELDLTVAIDTSVIHLAGAMGKPVWAVIAYNNDWRWLQKRSDTLWYPSMRLYRQPKLGDWNSAFARIREDLKRMVKS